MEQVIYVGVGPAWSAEFMPLLTLVLYEIIDLMAELNKAGTGVRVKIEIWVDHGKIVFSNVDQDFGPKGLIGSFVSGSAAEQRARELLVRHGVLRA